MPDVTVTIHDDLIRETITQLFQRKAGWGNETVIEAKIREVIAEHIEAQARIYIAAHPEILAQLAMLIAQVLQKAVGGRENKVIRLALAEALDDALRDTYQD